MKSEARDSQPTRRYHDRSFKAELVRQSLEPGASVAAIALQNGINANLLFKWRRMHLRANRSASAAPSAVLLPVCVTQTAEPAATSGATVPVAAAAMSRATRTSVIELDIAGAQLRLRGAVDEASLCSVLRALRHSA